MPALSRRDFLKWSCATALALCAPGIHARDLLVLKQVELALRGDVYFLVGGYAVDLPDNLADALKKGITLTFDQTFEVERTRDYWFAESVAVVTRTQRLSYNALLRQYQLVRNSAHESFDNLAEALNVLGDLGEWQVLERARLEKKRLHRARVRMHLDTSQLAKPLQMNAFASSRWDLDSGWREWTFKP